MEQLEHAVQQRKRIALRRRGNEHIVIASRLCQVRGREAVAGELAMTGEELVFVLDDVDQFQVLGT